MIPTAERLLLGPGPSPVSRAVLNALSAPARSHLDPELLAMLDDIRARLQRLFFAPPESLVLAVSGTGTTAMEMAVTNLVEPGKRALAIVTGYFGDQLAAMMARHGAIVDRFEVEWGRAADPEAVRRALDKGTYDVVSIVHAETSTGVRNPIEDIGPMVRAHNAISIVDVVTSLGALPVDMDTWSLDVCYSCSQKGIGAPSGLSPIAFGARALGRQFIGGFSQSAELMDLVLTAGQDAGEPVWQLTMSPEYRALLKSNIADMKNVGGPLAGASSMERRTWPCALRCCASQ